MQITTIYTAMDTDIEEFVKAYEQEQWNEKNRDSWYDLELDSIEIGEDMHLTARFSKVSKKVKKAREQKTMEC